VRERRRKSSISKDGEIALGATAAKVLDRFFSIPQFFFILHYLRRGDIEETSRLNNEWKIEWKHDDT
jgi:hypothetical protein